MPDQVTNPEQLNAESLDKGAVHNADKENSENDSDSTRSRFLDLRLPTAVVFLTSARRSRIILRSAGTKAI
jgi:hypothetical protein